MFDMRMLKASMVMYVLATGGLSPIDRGAAWELSNAS